MGLSIAQFPGLFFGCTIYLRSIPPSRARVLVSWGDAICGVLNVVWLGIAQRNRKPQLTVREPGNQDAIATLEFHTWSRKMDADVRGEKFPLSSSKLCWKSVDVHYESPVFRQAMTWKRSTIWVVLAITLADAQGSQIARFEPVLARKKFGRIHLFRDDLTRDQVDEVVFTGLSVMQDTYFYTTQQAGSAAGAASGAAAAVA